MICTREAFVKVIGFRILESASPWFGDGMNVGYEKIVKNGFTVLELSHEGMSACYQEGEVGERSLVDFQADRILMQLYLQVCILAVKSLEL